LNLAHVESPFLESVLFRIIRTLARVKEDKFSGLMLMRKGAVPKNHPDPFLKESRVDFMQLIIN
jgi:hypothetical protein